jgi:hypothetical protein
MAGLARPTLRCLREDLALAVPRADTPLEGISHPNVADLLPGHDDDLRWRAEAAVRTERRLKAVVHDLVRQSLLDGHEHAAMLDGAALGIQILADQGHETYVAIRIIGSVPRRLVATILSLIPGCELDAWMSDYAMPERAVAPEEQIWSNIMDPVAAAKFFDQK